MSNFEYKTVALPRSIAKRRRRRQTEADMIAEQLGKVLNDEATEGWEYVRAETLTTPGQSGLFKQATPAAYVVLIFRRARDAAWQRHEDPRNEPGAQSNQSPIRPAAAAGQAPAPAPTQAAPMATPVAPAVPAAPASGPVAAPAQSAGQDVRFGTTSVQLVSNAEGGSVSPLRPLGSARD